MVIATPSEPQPTLMATTRALLTARPNLLHSGAAGRALRDRLPVMLDSSKLSTLAHRELGSIRYAFRLAEA
ncbi:hypothetical protein [Streptomyces sp. NPDC001530]|uniref:hypothetical protein n=1 Tax=Streptomyces sp. NPDC001530 TaxID=3364582 RepID=UPI0036A2925E